MSDTYFIRNLKCAYCGEDNDFEKEAMKSGHLGLPCTFEFREEFVCDTCKKKNEIVMDFVVVKSKSQMKVKNVVALIDFANVKASYRDRGYRTIDLEVLYNALSTAGITMTRFYYGTDTRNEKVSSFFAKVASFGYEIVTKPVQYFNISFLGLLKKPFNRRWIEKCLRALGKSVTVVSDRKYLSGELLLSADKFVTLGLLDKFVPGLLIGGDNVTQNPPQGRVLKKGIISIADLLGLSSEPVDNAESQPKTP